MAQLKIFLKLCCFPSPGSTAVHASPSTSSHDTGASHGIFEHTPPSQRSLRSQGCHPLHPAPGQVMEGRSTSTMGVMDYVGPRGIITPHTGASPGVPGTFAPRAGTHNFSTSCGRAKLCSSEVPNIRTRFPPSLLGSRIDRCKHSTTR